MKNLRPNAVVAIYIYGIVPEFLLRFLAWTLVHIVYRLDKRGIDKVIVSVDGQPLAPWSMVFSVGAK